MKLTITVKPAMAGGVIVSPTGDYIGPGQVGYTAVGTIVTLTAYAFISGAVFDHWEGNETGNANPGEITMTGGDKAVTAVFNIPSTAVTVSLTTDVIGLGSVAPSEGIFNQGDGIILVATPAKGAFFSSWSGDTYGATLALGTPSRIGVTMNKDRHITAKFGVGVPEVEKEKEKKALDLGKWLPLLIIVGVALVAMRRK